MQKFAPAAQKGASVCTSAALCRDADLQAAPKPTPLSRSRSLFTLHVSYACRPIERLLCAVWKSELMAARDGLRVRLNYPYRGVACGLVTSLRKAYGPSRYAGIELQINQNLLHAPLPARRRLVGAIRETLLRAIETVK